MGVRIRMSDLGRFCERMRYWCDEGNLGYCQEHRQDIRYGGECDCSSLVLFALVEAGFDVGSASYTGNMAANLVARGWRRMENDGRPRKGDILLNEKYHVAVWLGNCLAQASVDERGLVCGGQPGDQGAPNGRGETNTRSYYDYPWDFYLRWQGGKASGAGEGASEEDGRFAGEDGRFAGDDCASPETTGGSSVFGYVCAAQRWLLGAGYSVGSCGIDGNNGPDTHKALTRCLQDALNEYGAGLAVDGSYGPFTKSAVGKYGPVCLSCGRKSLVRAVQAALLAAGFSVGPCGIDGSCGSATDAAIRSFQRASSLKIDGYAGPETCERLFGSKA